MTHVSHHDTSRTGVGRTAIGVAGFRAIESLKPEAERLIYDEFAIRIMEKNPVEEEFMKIFTKEKLDAMVNGLAVRTKKIDDEILSDLASAAQVVVIGAGLDFRPWRIHQSLTPDSSLLSSLSTKRWFEIDFQEIFDFKTRYLSPAEGEPVQSRFEYVPIVGNACRDDWLSSLRGRGFDRSGKTIWLLEGFTGYLTEEEVSQVFTKITEASCTGSKLIATFLGPNYKAALDMHRFKTSSPTEFVSRWGWEGRQIEFGRMMEEDYHRSGREVWEDYYLVTAYLSK